MRSAISIPFRLCLVALAAAAVPAPAQGRPNVVVIVSDDHGYGDVSYHGHPKDVSTPNLDRLAAAGIQLTNGYASGNVCAPTRAGLMTGRYQQRYGFYTAGDSRLGLPLGEVMLPELLRGAGYATGAFGKWHLGLEPAFRPRQRGFDEFYGFLGHGAHDYFDLTYRPDAAHNAIYRNDTIVDDTGYLTDNLAREATSFIRRHQGRPFFLYLAFNAVHFPLQAPAADVQAVGGTSARDTMIAMLRRMDLAIGEVLNTLRSTGTYDNTLIVFQSDNGGARNNAASNLPLRDYKHSFYEGGIRVPFLVSWPGKLQPGVYHQPVISLDILPTIAAAVGFQLPGDREYDGRNLLPALRRETTAPPHERLFFDDASGAWAVRAGQWKLVSSKQEKLELFDLAADVSEKRDLSKQRPAVVQRLRDAHRTWRRGMGRPMGGEEEKEPAGPRRKTKPKGGD